MARKQRGMSLVLVMVVVTALSLIMMTEASRRQATNRDRKMLFTLAQTEYILNSVYAFYKKRGEWPVTSGDCDLPVDFLPDSPRGQQTLNGWGEVLEEADGCSRNPNENYRLWQRVPDHLAAVFRSRISERTETRGSRDGFTTVEIYLNRSGGASKMVTISEFAYNRYNSPRYDVPICTNAAGGNVDPLVVVGMNGACASGERTGSASYVYGGFRTRLVPLERRAYYDYYVVDPEVRHREDGTQYTVYGLDGSNNDARYPDDGLYNADENCPSGLSPDHPIQSIVLAWCPPPSPH